MVNVGVSVKSLPPGLLQDPGLCIVLTPFLPLTLRYVLDGLCMQFPVQGQVFPDTDRSSLAGEPVEGAGAHPSPGGFSSLGDCFVLF